MRNYLLSICLTATLGFLTHVSMAQCMAVGNGINGQVLCMYPDTANGWLYTGGGFGMSGTDTLNNCGYWNDTVFHHLGMTGGYGTGDSVWCMTMFKGKLYVGGSFIKAGNVTANRIAMWDGSAWHAVGNGFDATVHALAVYNGSLYAAGDFSHSGVTYLNANTFGFTAVGFNTPNLWHGLAIYAIALSQNANNISTSLKSPGLGTEAVSVHGDGSNQAVFIKAAMPLGKGFSFGVLLSYERSLFNAIADNGSGNSVRYQTDWRPSGGLGVTWQPVKRILVGFRGLFNNDWERRIDNVGISEGMNSTNEYRLGISIGLWKGALIDIGGNARFRSNQIAGTAHEDNQPNIGIEQNLFNRHLAIRTGLDETSQTAGFSIRFKPLVLDVAYVHDLGFARFGNLFGTNSDSFILTLVFNYEALRKKG